MPLYCGIGGVKHKISGLYTGVGGVKKQLTEMWTAQGGVKKLVYRSKIDITVSTSPSPGISYADGLTGISPDIINEIANSISNNSQIDKTTAVLYVDFENEHRKLRCDNGAPVQIIIYFDGGNYGFDIIGFNHDPLSDSTTYGDQTVTGKAGITFQLHDLLGDRAFDSNFSNQMGWEKSQMRTVVMPDLKRLFQPDWQSIIKNVNKISAAKGGSQSTGTITSSDDLFLLAEKEIFSQYSTGNSPESEARSVSRYAYYANDNSTQKSRDGYNRVWWARSPSNGDSYSFCTIDASGKTSTSFSDYNRGISFAFCV